MGISEPVRQPEGSPTAGAARGGRLVQRFSTGAPGAAYRASRLAIRVGYAMTNHRLRRTDVNCMNFGWASLEGDGVADGTRLAPQDIVAADRFGLQLYEQVAATHVEDKRVLEVGSGRGGGASFVHRALGARDVTGVDLTPSSVRWCTRHWSEPGLRFAIGDAEQLSFPSESFDAVINVESSHNYWHVDRFLAEVHRVLQPEGVLLLTDFRPTPEMPMLVQQIQDAGFVIDENVDITANVVRALTLTAPEREAAKRRHRFQISHDWATDFLSRLSNKESEYRRFVARKI